MVPVAIFTPQAARYSFDRGGWAAVNVKARGRSQGSGRLLAAGQEDKIQRLIQDRAPDQLKLSYALWARPAASELI
jgi:hypothetical protein